MNETQRQGLINIIRRARTGTIRFRQATQNNHNHNHTSNGLTNNQRHEMDAQKTLCYKSKPKVADVLMAIDFDDDDNDDNDEQKLQDIQKQQHECFICMDPIYKTYSRAGLMGITPITCPSHTFHLSCFKQWYSNKQHCPMCRTQLSTIRGHQPAGQLKVNDNLPYIHLHFVIPSGVQTEHDPIPRTRYQGLEFHLWLPKDDSGYELCERIQLAWNRHLLFRIGFNPHTGRYDKVCPNGLELYLDARKDAHISTSMMMLSDQLKKLYV